MAQNAIPGGKSLDAQAKIDAAYAAYLTSLNGRLQTVPSIYQKIAGVATTDAVVTTQLWLSRSPAMRQWTGAKLKKKFRGMSHVIRTNPYEATVLVPKDDILNDKYGLYGDAIAGMASAYPEALDAKVCAIYNAFGGTTLGATYDGQNLLDTDHTIISGGSNQSNLVTGAFSATKLDEAFQKFGAMRDEEGVALVRKPRYLLHGYALRNTVRKLLGQDALATGESNMDKGILEPVLSPYISGTNWFVLVESPRAVVVHIKRSVEFLAVDDPNSDFAFETGNFKYGIEAEFGAAPALWEDVVGGAGS